MPDVLETEQDEIEAGVEHPRAWRGLQIDSAKGLEGRRQRCR